MRIGFITDSIREKMTGIGVYAKGIINSFPQYHPEHTYYYIDHQEYNISQNAITIPNPFPFGKKSIWYNYIPYKLKNTDLDYIFNFFSLPHFFPFHQKEVFFIHDLSTILMPEFHTRSSHILYTLLYKKTLFRAHKIVVNSIATKISLLKEFDIPEDKIHVLYIPIDGTHLKKQKITIPTPYILNINTIEPRKNIENLVLAYEQLRREKKILHKLIIAGQLGWRYSYILKKIKDSLYSKDIILTGYITDEQKKYLLTNADIFVYPSHYEGLGIPVFEASLYKCPVLSTDIPMMQEYIKNGGFVIQNSDVNTLAKSIYLLLNDSKKREFYVNRNFDVAKALINKSRTKKELMSFNTFLKS